jgi:hypothetical protein
MKLPVFIVDAVAMGKKLWGIGPEWNVQIELRDNPGGSERNDGSTSYSYRYLNATIDLKRDHKDNPLFRKLIVHEVGHLAMAEIDEAVEKIIAHLPADDHKFMRELYEDAQEKFLQRASRCMVDYVEGRQ